MKTNINIFVFLLAFFFCSLLAYFFIGENLLKNEMVKDRTIQQYDNILTDENGDPDGIFHQYMMTRDPQTGEIPLQEVYEEYLRIRDVESVDPNAITWQERGPDNVGGRTRAIMWDPNDPTYKKVWAGGVSGGLYYNDDIGAPSSAWHKVNDFWSNLAISCIAYDPVNTQFMYVGTGECWYNHFGIAGLGIWSSTDGGNTWNQLPSTNNDDFRFIQKIVVHPITRDVYAATKYLGIMRSSDFGASWDTVLSTNTSYPSFSDWATDIEITADNELVAALGFRDWHDGIYISSTGNEGDWVRLNDGTNILPTTQDSIQRIELAVAPSDADVIYALIENKGLLDKPGVIESDLRGIFRSTDKGQTWDSLPIPVKEIKDGDTIYFSGDQTIYDLIAKVHPEDPNTLFVGGVTLHRYTEASGKWIKIQNIHVDHHAMEFKPDDPQTLLFGNDGGVYLTEDCLASSPFIIDCNGGYRVTQFHAVAIHPSSGRSYFLGGTQDNGSQQFTHDGINVTNEVKGADGGFCYIFKSDPSYQIVSTQYNNFFLSTDNGNTFNDNIFSNTSTGKFISHWDYDETHDILYATYDDSRILRIFNVTDASSRLANPFSYNNSFANWITTIKLSPFSDNVLFVGTQDSHVYKITNPESSSNSTYIVDLIGSPPFFANQNNCYTNCIELGANEDQILVIFSNYGIASVWETMDGGNHWDDKEGNLPNMPIYWAIYNPLDYRQVLLATELGVWTTEDITDASPVWVPVNNGLANVRTQMLRIRESDKMVIAGTYGRGLYSTNSLSVCPSNKLLASDGKEDDNFGTSVATNGDFAIIGAPAGPMITGLEDNPGAIYIFEQLNNQWTESEKIPAPDGEPGDQFGIDVDMDNDRVIVGARLNGTSGAAYIYKFTGTSWDLEGKITPDDGGINDNFGNSVAISGEVAAVGSYSHGVGGAVYIFNYQDGNWVQTQKIPTPAGEINDWFGYSVDLQGDHLLVGNPNNNIKGTGAGLAYYYYYQDNQWIFNNSVIYGDQTDEADNFGWSVAIDYPYAVIGAKQDEGLIGAPGISSGSGTAYVFHYEDNDWYQTAMLQAADAQAQQAFGSSVSIFGDYILIGAERDFEQLGTANGAAYVFRDENGNGVNWLQQNKLLGGEGQGAELFGNAVYLFGTTAIVASKYDDDKGYNSGSAYVFNSIVNTSTLPVLSVIPSSFKVSSDQTTFDISINNNAPANSMDWSAYSLDPWLQFIGDSSGTNSGVLSISIDENLYCPRKGRVIVRAPGAVNSPREIFISQEANPVSHEVDITLPFLDEFDNFAEWVDIDEETAIASAPYDDELAEDAGAAYIFERDGCCSWIRKAKLTASDAIESDALGYCVAVSGDVAIASSIRYDDPRIYLFQKPPGGWHDTTESAILLPPAGEWNYTFGWAIDISGEYVIASVPGAYPPYIVFYERPPGGWEDMEPTEVFIKDIFGGFGESVIIDGNYAVIGSPMEDENTGCIYVYERDWVWGEQARFTISDGGQNDQIGETVDFDGDLIIAGSRIGQAAYIFRNNGERWIEEQKLTHPPQSGFGFAWGTKPVAISDNIAIVGDHLQGDGGCVYSYVYSSGSWTLSKQTFPSDVQMDEYFGSTIAISGPYTIINSYGKQNIIGQVTGGAYIFCTESDIVSSESCLPEGIAFTTQTEIENFLSEHPNCSKIEGDVIIEDDDEKKDAITNLDGLSALTSIDGNLSIKNNDQLEDITGLENLTSIGGFLYIASNASLTSLSGLDNINSGSIFDLTIVGNTSLSQCEVQSVCYYIAAANGSIIIEDNAAGCNSVDEVEAACDTLSVSEIHVIDGFRVYPNPFTNVTSFEYTLDRPENIRFTVYNVQSQIVFVKQERQEKGEQRIQWNAEGLPAGIYYFRIQAGEKVGSGKMVKME